MMNTCALIGGVPGWVEIMVILIVIILLFGAKRLPELARSLGRSMTEFKRGRTEGLPAEDEDASDTSSDKS